LRNNALQPLLQLGNRRLLFADLALCVAKERGATVCCISPAGCVAVQRCVTSGRVPVGIVAKQREKPGGRVAAAGSIAKERCKTNSRVRTAARIVKERLETNGCVADARCVVQERIITKECVVVGGVAALLTNGRRLRGKPKASEDEQK